MFLPEQLRGGFDTQVYYIMLLRPDGLSIYYTRTTQSNLHTVRTYFFGFHCLFPDNLRTRHTLRPRRPTERSILSRLVALLLFLPGLILDHTVPAGAALGNVPFLRFSCAMSVSVAVTFTLALTMSLALALSRSIRLTTGWHALILSCSFRLTTG